MKQRDFSIRMEEIRYLHMYERVINSCLDSHAIFIRFSVSDYH